MIKKQQIEQESPLKSRRDQLGLTQRDVAIAVNVSVQTVSNWETGRYREAKLTLPQVKALCRVLQWTIDDLPDDLASPRSQSADNV
ncbi:MAG: helix-turn-helix transcriptional regulator [Coleofasciculus sp. G3-WIS-01]|uniref:helix-turn-helix transcriptional regulator n=1 Tax=Coleofasciculus sp. G3-WIS-01 TaxID=3069528 RepID=UPI0032F3E145